MITEEIATKVDEQMEQKQEEVNTLSNHNGELQQKVQSLTNELAVTKSDAEIFRQKAR